MNLYHGTSAAYARQIEKYGLQPRATRGDHRAVSSPDTVYLTEWTAPAYAAAKSGFAPMIGRKPGEMGFVEVVFSALDETRLRPDEDYLRYADVVKKKGSKALSSSYSLCDSFFGLDEAHLRDYYAKMGVKSHLWAESLRVFGVCAYEGEISPQSLRVVTFGPEALEIGGYFARDTMAESYMDAPVQSMIQRDFMDCILSWSARTKKSHLEKADLVEAFSIPWPRLWVAAWKRFQRGGLPANSIHGPGHWLNVQRHANSLSSQVEGADPVVCSLFGVLHDAARIDEGRDSEHGRRGAIWLDSLEGNLLGFLSHHQFATLREAIATHADGTTSSDPTIGICFDADRLDLPRVGVTPNPAFLSTQAARDFQSMRSTPTLSLQEIQGLSPLRSWVTT